MPPNTRKVARTTPFGNHVGRGMTDPSAAVAAFKHWVETEADAEWRESARSALRGKNLACWCRIGEPCHADVLLAWLEVPRR